MKTFSYCATWLLIAFTVTAESKYEATVHRDAYGVPHVMAKSEVDAAYALGQLHCEDRLNHLIYCLHAGAGRLTEIMGENLLQADMAQRRLRHVQRAKADWDKFPPVLRKMLTAYIEGVNDWLAAHPDRVGAPLRPFTPLDAVAWHRQLMMLSTDGIIKLDANTPLSQEHSKVEPGKSNSWAVDGSKTATGRPLLLIDPHWPADSHLALYESHIIAGDLNVWGFMSMGSPVIGLGANEHVAWTFTAGGADSTDAYLLKIHPDNPDLYQFNGRWLPMQVEEEVFIIRNKDLKTFREHREKLRWTHQGPVQKNDRGDWYAAAHASWDNARSLEQFLAMNQAASTKQFKKALAQNRLSYFNVMWATREGDIGYVQTGDVPRRPAGYDWERLVPGWTSQSQYSGRLPFDELPQVENPQTHFLQNCNVAANVVTPGLRFTKADFAPGALWGHYDSYRARGNRATQLLSAASRLDSESARKIAFDTYVPPADLWLPILFQGIFESGNPEDLQPAVQILREWNRRADIQSTGATLFRFWRYACEQLPQSQVGRDALRVLNNPENRRDAVVALRSAVQDMQQRFGKLEVPWGEVKRLRRGKQEWPLSGDGLGRLGMDTLRATAADQLDSQNKLIAAGGQSTMGLVFLGEKPIIHAVVAYGQSFNPGSPHFADQARLYAEHRLRPVPWTREEIEAQTTSILKVRK